MPTVTYVQPDGARQTCVLAPGDSVMDGALDHAVPGILGRCGGGCTCATCHCYVPEPYFSRLPRPHGDELEMLEHLPNRRPGSRLSCQIVPGASEHLVVEIPLQQL